MKVERGADGFAQARSQARRWRQKDRWETGGFDGFGFIFLPFIKINLASVQSSGLVGFAKVVVMPVTCPITFEPSSREEFAQLDYLVMNCAFDVQNVAGRLCDEPIYRNDLAAQVRSKLGLEAHAEVPLTVFHGDFSKTYRLDLVVEKKAIYELKTVGTLLPEFDAQLLNYLMLAEVVHGKLVNFRSPKVQARFVNAPLTLQKRRCIVPDTTRWRERNDRDAELKTILLELIADWGLFLELSLYTEGLIHFLGGEENVIRPVPLERGGVMLGMQPMTLISPDTAFRLTALTESFGDYEHHLNLLLNLTPLHAIQWVNLAHHDVQFTTLQRG